MMDQYQLPLSGRQALFGSKSQSNKLIQRRRDTEKWFTGHVDIIALVRSLQRAAGMTDCFRMGNVDCDVVDCDWRTYCLGNLAAPSKK